ncbi:MAG: hypothetical protein FWC75_06315 [Oscillospiraceae bacterium]|nr:hypothetical protein [Oscillospiraceae bacterium]
MVKFVFLTQEFYDDFAKCPEILHKDDRPHIQLQIEIGVHVFCVPLRSNINHPHVLWTDKANKCGLDFSKTVVITDAQRHINKTREPIIRQIEFDSLRGKEHIIKTSLKKYIANYKDAKKRQHIQRYRTLLQCSTLQYFEEHI